MSHVREHFRITSSCSTQVFLLIWNRRPHKTGRYARNLRVCYDMSLVHAAERLCSSNRKSFRLAYSLTGLIVPVCSMVQRDCQKNPDACLRIACYCKVWLGSAPDNRCVSVYVLKGRNFFRFCHFENFCKLQKFIAEWYRVRSGDWSSIPAFSNRRIPFSQSIASLPPDVSSKLRIWESVKP